MWIPVWSLVSLAANIMRHATVVFAAFSTEQKRVVPKLPDGSVRRGKRQRHSARLLLLGLEASAHGVQAKCRWRARWDSPPVPLQIHLVSGSAPLAALQPEATRCSSPSPGHRRGNCRPFVSIRNAVRATRNPTFLEVVMARWDDAAAPLTGQRPGSRRVAGMRRGRWNWHCVVSQKL